MTGLAYERERERGAVGGAAGAQGRGKTRAIISEENILLSARCLWHLCQLLWVYKDGKSLPIERVLLRQNMFS